MKYCYYCMNEMNDGDVFCPYCGKSFSGEIPAHHLIPGTVLHGKFVVGIALGEGGFGITYIGRDRLLDIRVAIKEYYPNGYVSRSNTVSSEITSSNTEQRKEFFDKGREKFLKEAQILARFSGEPGIVDVRDFFEENNTAYIVMEYLDGETLKKYIKRSGRMTPEKTVNLLMPVIRSLSKVHANGLIHRDISPDNIMLLGNGNVKLLDFGAARNVSAEAQKSLSVMLKPGYAPEEQYRSKGNQGPWTDVYALSATMYKCITGITPDDSTQRVFSDEVKTLSELGIQTSPAFDKALMKGLAVLQKNRYQSVGELLDGLEGKDAVQVPQDDDDDEKTIGIGLDLPAAEENDEKTVGLYDTIPENNVIPQNNFNQEYTVNTVQPKSVEMPETAAPEPRIAPQYAAPVRQEPQTAPLAPSYAPVRTPAPAPVPAAEKSSKKIKKGVIIAISAAALAVIAAVILVISGVIPLGSSGGIVGEWYGECMSVPVEDDLEIPIYWTWSFDKSGNLHVKFDKKDYLKRCKKALAQYYGVSENEMNEIILEETYYDSFDEYMSDLFDDQFDSVNMSAQYEIDGNLLTLSFDDFFNSSGEGSYEINLSGNSLTIESVEGDDDVDLEKLLPLTMERVN